MTLEEYTDDGWTMGMGIVNSIWDVMFLKEKEKSQALIYWTKLWNTDFIGDLFGLSAQTAVSDRFHTVFQVGRCHERDKANSLRLDPYPLSYNGLNEHTARHRSNFANASDFSLSNSF